MGKLFERLDPNIMLGVLTFLVVFVAMQRYTQDRQDEREANRNQGCAVHVFLDGTSIYNVDGKALNKQILYLSTGKK